MNSLLILFAVHANSLNYEAVMICESSVNYSGTSVLLRELNEKDRQGILEFYLSLNEEDRRSRFNINVRDETLVNYVNKMDFNTCVLVGACVNEKIVGIAEMFIAPSSRIQDAEDAEMAIVMKGDSRGTGMSRRMMEFLKIKAKSIGIHRIHVYFSMANTPMRKLAHRIGLFESGPVDDRIAQTTL